jgi:hypothetical protein
MWFGKTPVDDVKRHAFYSRWDVKLAQVLLTIVALSVLVIVFVLPLVNRLRDPDRFERVSEGLATELAAIQAPEEVEQVDINHSYKNLYSNGSALVTLTYETTLSKDQVFQHYSDELLENGWRFLEEGTVNNIHLMSYCKDAYRAQVGFYESPDDGKDYYFDMSWDDTPDC